MKKILFTMLCCAVFFIGCQQKDNAQQDTASQPDQTEQSVQGQVPADDQQMAPQREIPIDELPVEIQEKIRKEIELENQRDPKIYPTEKETSDAQLMRANKIKNRVLAEEAAKNQ